MKVVAYREDDAGAWDALVAVSRNATFLHTRRFLSYHKARFRDASLLVLDDEGRLVAVLPAARDPADETAVTSHPGLTYGGLACAPGLAGGEVLHALEAIVDALRRSGIRRFHYRAIPRVFQRVPSEEDLYALFRLGARRVRCDLSAAVDLRAPAGSAHRERDATRAQRLGITISESSLHAYWPMLEANLRERHGAAPVHSEAEMRELMGLFPDAVSLVCASAGDQLAAGAVLFDTGHAVHTQYLASTPEGREQSALDLVIFRCLARARAAGRAYFSFGVSTERQGSVLNAGLHAFKLKDGAGGVIHETYAIDL